MDIKLNIRDILTTDTTWQTQHFLMGPFFARWSAGDKFDMSVRL